MDIFEIAIWRFVIPSTFFFVLVVYTQEPFAVLGETILFDEFILGLRGGMVVAPRVPLVVNELTLRDKPLGVLICAAVELHGHAVDPRTVLRPENQHRSVRAAELTLRNERRQL